MLKALRSIIQTHNILQARRIHNHQTPLGSHIFSFFNAKDEVNNKHLLWKSSQEDRISQKALLMANQNCYFMRKHHNLGQTYQNSYLQFKNKSKSPLNNFRKIPQASVFQKTPPKHGLLMGVTFSTKTSTKTLGQYDQTHEKRKGRINRNMTLQMEEICPRSEIDNAEQSNITPLSTKRDVEDGYFSRSLDKVLEVKSRRQASKISDELNEVLNMIKEEKLKVGEKMKILKKNNEYYRRICEGEVIPTQENGTNTIQIIDSGQQRVYCQAYTQVEQEQLTTQQQPVVQQKEAEAQRFNDIYHKLCLMLQEMDIDYSQILPENNLTIHSAPQKSYKCLSGTEIIKIQRFFIHKLASKIYRK